MTYPTPSSIRSTQVRLYLEQCPHSLDLYDQGTDDKAIYAVGTAAHDVAHAIGLYPDRDAEEVAAVVVQRLIESGRVGHDAEGPLRPDAVFAGRDIFLSWLYGGGDAHPHPGAKYEHGMGFKIDADGQWTLTAYDDPEAAFRIRPDVLYPVRLASEEGYGVGLVTRDYKTSWAAGQETCESIQLRAQAVATWRARSTLMTMEPDFIRREVVNLRTGAVFVADTWLDGAGRATMDRWQRDVATVLDAIRDGAREPRVGAHCLRCPYVGACEARKANEATEHDGDPKALALEYVLVEAWRKELMKRLREATAETAIELGDGTRVGYKGVPTRTPADDVHRRLWESWSQGVEIGGAGHSTARGALLAMKIGKTQLENVAKALYPDGDDKKSRRKAWVEAMTEPVTARRFGIWKG
jgi:hypothetical protein